MNRLRCKKCGKFISEKEALHYGNNTYCGDCALDIMVKEHGWAEDMAYHHLEQIQFGNGHGW
jgi:DNA-directed RNA polymerase subunit RPC12/RpoP